MEHIGTTLLFENSYLRIWNLLLEPGETAPTHQHEFPYVYVVLTPGETLMTESDGAQHRQSDDRWKVVEHSTGLPHSLQNVGTAPYANVIVEMKTAGDLAPDQLFATWIQSFSTRGSDDIRAHLDDNPGRITRGYAEFLAGYEVEASTILKVTRKVGPSEPRPGWVTVDEIDFVAMCPHHFLPYYGTASVSYRPTDRILGLGKLPRYVDALARRLVIQEDLTRDIAQGIGDGAATIDVKVTTIASHMCICRRGARQSKATSTVVFELGE